MRSSGDIEKIHFKLAGLYPRSLVFLGGSYLYNEATEDSDIDFFIISKLLNYKHKEKLLDLLELKREFPKIKVMFLPQLLYKLGLFYIYGIDKNGVIHSNARHINKKIMFRNGIKLAYFHFFKFIFANNIEEKKKALLKSAKQLAFVLNLKNNRAEPLFSLKNLQLAESRLSKNSRSVFADIFSGSVNTDSFDQISNDYKSLLDNVILSNQTYLRFSFLNYLIYNLKFLKRGHFEFLFSNPDKKILKKIMTAKIKDAPFILSELNKIIFPVYIV